MRETKRDEGDGCMVPTPKIWFEGEWILGKGTQKSRSGHKYFQTK